MKILVLNCGSSSIKFQLIDTDADKIKSNSDRCLAKGSVERIGTEEAALHFGVPPNPPSTETGEIFDHEAALNRIVAALKQGKVLADISHIQAVGHRVVHGGEALTSSVLIDDQVLREIEQCSELAPLHNPHNLKGYYTAKKALPWVPHVAVLDTAFHPTLPPRAYIYGLPYVYYRRYKIRRFGFHGTSHRYVAGRYAEIFGRRPEELNLITAHLGNGCSMTAIEKGKSVDTSMGFTPLEGLVMGTRSGDVDPSAVLYVMSKDELTMHDTSSMLRRFSGLYGISGESNDMRELIAASEKGSEQSRLAVEVFCYRVKKFIGAYTATLGRVDALIFTAGIGENSPLVRAKACEGLAELGFEIDPDKNTAMVGKEGLISSDSSRARVVVIPTNEELMIARDTFHAVSAAPPPR